MIYKYTSIKTVLAKIYRDLQLNQELPESDVIEWIAEALSMIGAYSQYEEISDCLELSSGKAKLPCNFEALVDISYKGLPVYWATNTNQTNYQCKDCRIPRCIGSECLYTFYINDSYIISNIGLDDNTNEKLCIVYNGIPVDEDGYPRIPDDVYYIKALTAYVTYMLDRANWRKGRVNDKVVASSEQDWLFYVNSARGSANLPNVQQLESLKNTIKRLFSPANDYKTGFSNFNKPEKFNLK